VTGVEVVIGNCFFLYLTPLSKYDIIGHVTIRLAVVDFSWVVHIVTMRLFSTVMEIWPFEVIPGRLFQEQKSLIEPISILH